MNSKKLFKTIAQKHGISVKQLKQDMQAAIDEAYAIPNFYARCIPRQEERPTPEEIISYATRRVSALR